ncbi:MAG: hypothetical protein GYA55_07110 [SAR324 cluster bacterium]|uniref:Uncharacterized protein n=1 Tax=SAR324 cluster bacterium TaxID=2024889 RepID=A0A7X9IJB2_9DELT|nr:hypothetical protein [SAR324 cluster bacterium]
MALSLDDLKAQNLGSRIPTANSELMGSFVSTVATSESNSKLAYAIYKEAEQPGFLNTSFFENPRIDRRAFFAPQNDLSTNIQDVLEREGLRGFAFGNFDAYTVQEISAQAHSFAANVQIDHSPERIIIGPIDALQELLFGPRKKTDKERLGGGRENANYPKRRFPRRRVHLESSAPKEAQILGHKTSRLTDAEKGEIALASAEHGEPNQEFILHVNKPNPPKAEDPDFRNKSIPAPNTLGSFSKGTWRQDYFNNH